MRIFGVFSKQPRPKPKRENLRWSLSLGSLRLKVVHLTMLIK